MAAQDLSQPNSPTASPQPTHFEDDPRYRKIEEEESLNYLRKNDANFFNKNYSGIAPSGYLLDRNGNETPFLPSQNLSGKSWGDVVERARTNFALAHPEDAQRYHVAARAKEIASQQERTQPSIATTTPIKTEQTTQTNQPQPTPQNDIHGGPIRDGQRQAPKIDQSKQTNFKEFDQVIVKQVKDDTRTKQPQLVQTQLQPKTPQAITNTLAKPLPVAALGAEKSNDQLDKKGGATQGKASQSSKLIIPNKKPMPASTPTITPPKQRALSSALGFGVIGATVIGKVVKDVAKANSKPISSFPSTATEDSTSLAKAHKSWRELLREHEDLSKIRTLEQFKEWLTQHPGLTNPLSGKPLSPEDWLDHNAYEDYLQIEPVVTPAPVSKPDQTSEEKHPTYYHTLHYTAPIPNATTVVDDEQEEEEVSDQPSETHPATTEVRSERPVAQSPIHSSSTSRSQGRAQPPPPPKRIGLPSIGGLGNIGKLASNLRNFSNPVGIAVTVWQNKTLIGITCFVLIFLVFNILSGGSDNTATGNVGISTGDTSVANPDAQVEGASTSIFEPSPTPEKAVLDASTNIFTNILGLLLQGKQKLDSLAQKYKDSLITYTITANYNGQADDVIVHYHIPDNALLVKASGISTTQTGTVNGFQKTTDILWKYSENNGGSTTSSTSNPVTPDLSRNTDPAIAKNSSTDTSSTARNTAPTSGAIDITKYEGAPYYLPAPNGPPTITFSQNDINNANTLGAAIQSIQPYLLTKLSPEKADPFLAVMWTMAIEGSGADPYFWNCNDTSKGKANISNGCRGWYNSGNWQVGYGIQVSQAASHLDDDFKAIYGNDDAATVQSVGNKVLQGGGITNPATMPDKSVNDLVTEAGTPGTTFIQRPTTDTEAVAQQAIAILLMDPKIGAASIAQEVAGDIGNNWAADMRGWKQSYYINGLDPSNPTFSNNIKLLASEYSGVSSGGTTSSPSVAGGLGQKTFTITVLPLTQNDVVHSGIPSLEIINPKGGASANSSSGQTTGTTTGSGIGTTTTTGYVAPTTNACGGKYALDNPPGKNYGDPACDYDKNKLYEMLKQQDPQNADFWFNQVIPCESAYDPNVYFRCSAALGCTPDPNGAWGLFQMGSGATGPFINLDKGSVNNLDRPEDRGDVNWQLQIQNAVNYNKKYLAPQNIALGAYWACAQ